MASLSQEKIEAMEAEMNRFEAEILGEQEEADAEGAPLPLRAGHPRMIIGANTFTHVQAKLAAAAGHPEAVQNRTFAAAPPPPPPSSKPPETSTTNLHLPPPPPPPASMRHMFMPPQVRHRAPPPPRPPAPPMGMAPSGPPPPPPPRGPPPNRPPMMHGGPPGVPPNYNFNPGPPPYHPRPPPPNIRPPPPKPNSATISANPVIIAKPPQVNAAILAATKKRKKDKKDKKEKKKKIDEPGKRPDAMEEEASTNEPSTSDGYVAPGIQLNVPVEEIEAERAVHNTPVNEIQAMAASMERQLMHIQEQHEASIRPKKEKKKKFIRTAAGVVWEDPSLSEWDKDDFRIFAGDLGNEVTDEVLTRAFNKYPSFVKAKIVRDKRSNKTRGYGFVSFRDPNDFVRAMREMNGKYVGNRPIKLRKSSWKERQIDIVKKKDKEKKRLGLR